jgi:hypothetical protein
MDTLKPLDYAVIVFVAWMIRTHVTLILMFGQNALLSGVVGIWLFWSLFDLYCNWRARNV